MLYNDQSQIKRSKKCLPNHSARAVNSLGEVFFLLDKLPYES